MLGECVANFLLLLLFLLYTLASSHASFFLFSTFFFFFLSVIKSFIQFYFFIRPFLWLSRVRASFSFWSLHLFSFLLHTILRHLFCPFERKKQTTKTAAAAATVTNPIQAEEQRNRRAQKKKTNKLVVLYKLTSTIQDHLFCGYHFVYTCTHLLKHTVCGMRSRARKSCQWYSLLFLQQQQINWQPIILVGFSQTTTTTIKIEQNLYSNLSHN